MSETCETFRRQFAMMLYGELSFDEEERVETHLDECGECRQALARQKELHEAMSAAAVTPSPASLVQNRAQLSERLDRERRPGWFRDAFAGLRFRWVSPFSRHVLQPVAGVALLATGFLGAKLLPDVANLGGGFGQQASLLGSARVRNVSTDADGRVRIVLDQTQERTLSGTMDDEDIRALLVAASKNAPEADLRARTVTILGHDADADDVRQALVFVLANDRSDKVKTVAMKGLQHYAEDPAVQSALTQVLLGDGNTQSRTEAIDMLNAGGGVTLDRRLVGALQELMDHEDDRYVRDQCQRMLEALKASPEIY